MGTQAVTHNIQPAAFNYTISIRSLTSTGGFWQTAAQECHTRQNQDMLVLTGFSLTDAWILCFKMHMAEGCKQLLPTAALLFLLPRKSHRKALPPPLAWFCLSHGPSPSPEGVPWQFRDAETLSHSQKTPM